jgi:hypothetical protein
MQPAYTLKRDWMQLIRHHDWVANEFKVIVINTFHRRLIVFFRFINFFDFPRILCLCFREPPENALILRQRGFGHMFGQGMRLTT